MPWRYCAAKWCGNSSRSKNLAFFLFPKDFQSERYNKWSSYANLAHDHAHKKRFLCADHFPMSAFSNVDGAKKNRLKGDAVPSVCVTDPHLRFLVPPGKFQESRTFPANSLFCCLFPFLATQMLPPEPLTLALPVEEVGISSVEVITVIDVDDTVDVGSASLPTSPAFECEESPVVVLPDPSGEAVEMPASPDDSAPHSNGDGSYASEDDDVEYSSPASDSEDDETMVMMNIDLLTVEELRKSLCNIYRKYRRLKAAHVETVCLLEQTSGKVRHLEATLSALRSTPRVVAS
ncbi:unnamed protein product [Ixodes hexagonus]